VVGSIRPAGLSCTDLLLKKSAGHRRTNMSGAPPTGLQPARACHGDQLHRLITRRQRSHGSARPIRTVHAPVFKTSSNQTMTSWIERDGRGFPWGSRRCEPGRCALGSRRSDRPLNVIASRLSWRTAIARKSTFGALGSCFPPPGGFATMAIMRHTTKSKTGCLAPARRPQLRPKGIPVEARP
jgi:hypothetical protein